MELNLKDYKYSQLKKKLKINQLLLIFNVVYTKNNKTDNRKHDFSLFMLSQTSYNVASLHIAKKYIMFTCLCYRFLD